MKAVGPVSEKVAPRRVSIVDDDEPVREALKNLMRSARFDVEAFGSAEEFLASERLNSTEFLILDLYLPGMNGFDLQQHLNASRHAIPIIFITAHADETSRQRALRAGAVELLPKPVRRDALFEAIQSVPQF